MKKYIICGLISTFPLSFIGCSDKNVAPSLSNHEIKLFETINSNIQNVNIGEESFFSTKTLFLNDRLYFANKYENDILSIAKKENSNFLISDRFKFSVSSLCLLGSEIFFSNENDHSKLYKVNYLTNESAKLNDFPVKNIILKGTSLYFLNTSDDFLYELDLIDNSFKRISSTKISKYIITTTGFVFSSLEKNQIYHLSFDGRTLTHLSSESSIDFAVIKDTLFFFDLSDSYLYYIKDGTSKPVKTNIQGDTLKSNKDMLFFLNKNDYNNLYSLNFKNKNFNLEKISENRSNDFFLSDDFLFTYSTLNNSLIQIKLKNN